MKLLAFLAFLSLALMIRSDYIESGIYYIKNVKTGLYLNTCNTDICPKDPTNIWAYGFFGDEWQRFYVTKLENGYYTITTATVVKKNIESRYSYKPSKTLFLSSPDNYDQDQQFSIIPKGHKSFVIVPRELPDKAIESPLKETEEVFLGKKDFYNKYQRFYFDRYYEKC